MNIGMVCYASVGGSGIVATELGKALARRGHQVHFISTEMPFRLGEFQAGLAFHQVLTPTYPLFREPQYLLSLSNKIVQVAREFRLDIIHAHYAVPHATAAFLSRQVLGSTGTAPRVVTTLHGTDITLVGNDPSYSQIVAFSIDYNCIRCTCVMPQAPVKPSQHIRSKMHHKNKWQPQLQRSRILVIGTLRRTRKAHWQRNIVRQHDADSISDEVAAGATDKAV